MLVNDLKSGQIGQIALLDDLFKLYSLENEVETGRINGSLVESCEATRDQASKALDSKN